MKGIGGKVSSRPFPRHVLGGAETGRLALRITAVEINPNQAARPGLAAL